MKNSTNDCVRLALHGGEMSKTELLKLDLTLLQELKIGKDGAVELKLVDKMKLAEQLSFGENETVKALISALEKAGESLANQRYFAETAGGADVVDA